MAEDKKVRRKRTTGDNGPVKPPASEGMDRKAKAKLVSKVLQKMEKKLVSDELKPTVGDFIRLLQLERELEDEQPREIKVSWVDPEQKKDKDESADGK